MSTGTSRWGRVGRAAFLAAALVPVPTGAEAIAFVGYTWTVRSGRGGPGPSAWDAKNVWLDAATNLYLMIANRDGIWSCAEVTMQQRAFELNAKGVGR